MITIVDYGMGNLGSVVNMLRLVGAECEVTGDPRRIACASRILLPGVGAFDPAIERIDQLGIRTILDEKVLHQRTPVLGICLGMQLMTRGSEEGKKPGLGWIPATTLRFPGQKEIKVPHMGWNIAKRTRPSALTEGLDGEIRFYFVHSYYVQTDNSHDIVLQTHYGIAFAAAVQRDNIMGAQFHPEKSHRYGKQLLGNFVSMKC